MVILFHLGMDFKHIRHSRSLVVNEAPKERPIFH